MQTEFELTFESLDVEDHLLADDQPPIKLRKYQTDCLESIKKAWASGVNSGLIVLSTGLGKTVIASHLPRFLDSKKVLFLAHREELINQAYASLTRSLPDLKCGVEQAERCAEANKEVVVASVQTLGRRWRWNETDDYQISRRLERFNPSDFDIVIIDEAHRAVGKTYLRILQHLKAGTEDGPFLLGITATPERSDRQPLANVFDKILYEKQLKQSIKEGWLKRITSIKVRTTTSLDDVDQSGKDWNETQLAREVNVDDRNSLIYSALENHASDRKCILIFCVNIAHAEALCAQLVERGLAFGVIHSKIPLEDRRERLRAWRSGELLGMVNVGVLTEGFDLPRIDCICMARPTQSRTLYTQMLGRATRHICPKCHSGKIIHTTEELPVVWACHDCGHVFKAEDGVDGLIIDVVDVCGRHQPVTANEVFGIREIDVLGQDLLNAEEIVRHAEELGVNIDGEDNIDDVERRADLLEGIYQEIKYVETEAEAVDLFECFDLPNEVTEFSIFPWLKIQENGFQLNADRGRTIKMWKNTLGQWRLRDGVTTEEGGTTQNIPWKWADRLVKRALSERVFVSADYSVAKWRFLKTDAKWRLKPPTSKQVEFLLKLGVKKLDHNVNRGTAKLIIDAITTKRRARRIV